MAYASANALNMAQYAVMSNDPLVQRVTYALIDNGSIMARDIPFVNKSSLIAQGVRWTGGLPTVAWVPLNTDPTVITGAPTPYTESAYLLRNEIQADKYYVRDINQIQDPRQIQLQAYLKAQAYDFNDKFFNNTPTGDSNSIRGIRYRLDNPSLYGMALGSQPSGTVTSTIAQNKIDAGGAYMDLSSNTTAATYAQFIEAIDAALWAVNSPMGDNCVIYVNDVLKRRWDANSRRFAGGGGFSTAQDQLGRVVEGYKGARVEDAGWKADQATRIITATEGTTGLNSTSTYTSAYVVNYGPDAMMGWQFAPINAFDQGLLPNASTYSIVVDWMGGIFQASHKAIARVYDIRLG